MVHIDVSLIITGSCAGKPIAILGPVSSAQYFAEDPSVSSDPSEIELTLPDLSATLTVDRGVFSTQRVDAGSKLLLLEAAQAPEGATTLLDLGCGYGPIAVALAHRHPEAHVWAVDVNARARALTQHNVNALGFGDRCTVAAPDDVPSDVRFDYIASNPPIRVGKAVLHTILERWLSALNPDGVADLVVQKHLGSDSLARWMTSKGWTTERTMSRAGYRILRVTAATAASTEPPADPTPTPA